jgi:hypothetical protein
MYYIYALIDPRDNLVHYVGLTGNTPTHRLADHLTDRTGAKAEWLTDLLDAAFMPSFVVLQKADDVEQAQMREAWWISTGEMFGWPLTNVAKTMKQKKSTLEKAQPEVQREVVRKIKETNAERALNSKWQDVAKAWFAANPHALIGPAVGISDLARAMCRDNEGNDVNYEAYKGRAHKLFHEFRGSARLPGGDKFGTDITVEGK